MEKDRTNYLRDNNKLLEETLNDFSVKPFAFASLNDIVKRADFNKGSFYYRFRDKEELYLAMIDLINAEHLVLYNEIVLELKKPHAPLAIVLAAFEALDRLHRIDSRYPLVLERFANEEESFRKAILRQSLDFVFDRMILNLKHAGMNLKPSDDSYRALTQMYHGVHLWPMENRRSDRLTQMVLGIFPSAGISQNNKTVLTPIATNSILSVSSGLTYVLGNRSSGKTSLAQRLFKMVQIEQENAIVVFGQSCRAASCRAGDMTSYSLSKWAKLGESRWKHSDHENDSWGNLLRLNPKRPYGNASILAMYELVSLHPSVLIVDEPRLWSSRADLPLILEALLKFSTSGSTIVLSSDDEPRLMANASHIQFLSAGEIRETMDRATLRSRYPADQMTVRYLDRGIERVARIPFSATAMQAFQKDHPDAAILDVRSIAADWHQIFKSVTGEELS